MSKNSLQSQASKILKGLYRKTPKVMQNRIKRVLAESLPQPADQTLSRKKADETPGPNQNAQKIAVSEKDIGTTYNSEIVFPMLALEHNLLHQQLREARQEATELRSRLGEMSPDRSPETPRETRTADNRLVNDYLATQPNGAPRHVVLTSEYPRHKKELRTNVLHQRIKKYLSAGVAVDVVCWRKSDSSSIVERDGVRILEGRDGEIASLLTHQAFTSVSVHFLTPDIWAALEPFLPTVDVHVFIHGRETSRWVRKIPTFKNGNQLEDGIMRSIESQFFWHQVLNHPYSPRSYIFRSDWWRRAIGDDLCNVFPANKVHIIPDSKSSDLIERAEIINRELVILGLGD